MVLSTIMHYEVYEPTTDPTHAVIMANLLGGTLHPTGPLEGDHAYRARWIAEHSPAVVIAYERPATGGHIDRVTRSAAKIGRILSAELDHWGNLPTVLAGSSAGGLSVLEVANSQTIRTDYISVSDPAGLRCSNVWHGLRAWRRHQTNVEAQRTAMEHNQHPIPGQPPWSQIARAQNLLRTARDVRAYRDSWWQPNAISHLSQLARSESFAATTIHAEFYGRTFTATAPESAAVARYLQSQRPSSFAAPFVAEYYPDRLHSWPDDPARFAASITDTLAMRPLGTHTKVK